MKRFIAFILAVLTLSIPLTAFAAGDVYETSEKLVFTAKDGTVIPYRLVLPANYTDDKDYPMLVFFHGAGERGNDNQLQLFHCVQYLADNMPECIIVAPQCPLYNQWVDTPWTNGSYSTEKVPESNEMKAVMDIVAELQTKYSVDSDRIYAAGISMGGFATWNAMMLHNDVFAAGIAVCGGADPEKAEVLVDTPMFVFHGDRDSAVPVSGSREMVDAIKNAGGDKVEYIEYAGKDHNIWNDAFATKGLLDKLLECRLSDRIELPEESSDASVESSAESIESSTAVSEEETGGNAVIWVVIGIIAVAAIIAVAVFAVNKKKK